MINYTPLTEAQALLKVQFESFIAQYPDAYLRSNLERHMTASAFVVDADKILLIHHRKLNKWLQPGGHCDGDTDTLAVAIKEVEEETGVVIKPNDQLIIDLDIHRIPERKGIPAHDHYDVRYLLEADSSLPLLQNHETLDLRWIPLAEIHRYTDEESILRVTRQLSSRN
jgi:8-oxo-dGTP pyrophosphatase MutT (NUDIX family)